jgi:hypothetical protein
MMFTWQLILKPIPAPVAGHWQPLVDAVQAARGGNVEQAAAQLRQVPDDANPDYLAAAGRVSLFARDIDMARAYFARALETDPTSAGGARRGLNRVAPARFRSRLAGVRRRAEPHARQGRAAIHLGCDRISRPSRPLTVISPKP